MAKDDSRTSGKPSVRTRKASSVHKRRAKKPLAQAAKGKAAPKAEPKPRAAVAKADPEPKTAGAPKAGTEPKTAAAPSSDTANPKVDPTAPLSAAADPNAADAAPEADSATAKPSPTRTESFSDRLAEEPKQPKEKKRWKKRLAIGIAAVVVVALAVTAGLLSWNRWARYDDGADVQGIWYAYGTEVPVTFTQDSIIFDENTAYSYAIDPEAKTISYSIGDMEGQGRYWFSDGRDVLVITDGGGYTKWGTALEDAGHWASGLLNGASLPVSDQSIAFSRVPMSDGLLTAEPAAEPAAEPEPSAEPGSEPEPSSSSSSEAEAQPEEPADGKSGKEAMKELPISDIIIEDDTPQWGESDEQ